MDSATAAQRAQALIEKISMEFSPEDQIQATEGLLDRSHQKQLTDLMNAMFSEKSKVLKKMVPEMMAQKAEEYAHI